MHPVQRPLAKGLDPSHIRLQCHLTSPMCLVESNLFKRSALSVGHVDSGGANSKNSPAHDQNQCSRHQCLCACQRGLLCTRPQEILRTVYAPPNLLTEIASWTLHKTSSRQKRVWGLSITNAPGAHTSFKEALADITMGLSSQPPSSIRRSTATAPRTL